MDIIMKVEYGTIITGVTVKHITIMMEQITVIIRIVLLLEAGVQEGEEDIDINIPLTKTF
jgi:hypothetical protein